MTQTAKYWNLHTEELIELAARDIYHDVSLGSQRTDVVRSWTEAGYPDIRLEVMESDHSALPCPIGTTLVKTGAGWEVLSDAEASSRGIPIPTLEP
jgi:hypothetical protein